MNPPIIPGGCFSAFELNLTDRPEAGVGDDARFLRNIDAITRQIFFKSETLQIVENFKERRIGLWPGRIRASDMVTGALTNGRSARGAAYGNRNFTMTGKSTR